MVAGMMLPPAVLDARFAQATADWIEALEPRLMFAATPTVAPARVLPPQFGAGSVSVVAAPTSGASGSPFGGNAFNGYSVGPNNVQATPATAALLGINGFTATAIIGAPPSVLESNTAAPAVGATFGNTPISASSLVDSVFAAAGADFIAS